LVNVQPCRDQTSAGHLQNILISLSGFVLLFDLNHVTGLYLIGRDIDLLAVYQNMLVIYNLSGLLTGTAKAHTEQNVVQSALQQAKQVLTVLTAHTVCLLIVITERLLQNAVDEFGFLLFSQLHSILADF